MRCGRTCFGTTTATPTRCADDQVGEAEPSLQWALRDAHILYVFKRNRCLINAPDSTSNSHAAVAKDIPCRIVAQVNRNVRQYIGHHDHDDPERSCDQSPNGGRNDERKP